MMRRTWRSLAFGLTVTALSGCAASDLVVVLPEADGHVGAVQVETGGDGTLLNTAYASARPRAGAGAAPVFSLPPEKVKAIFGPALAALPPAPKTYQIYYDLNSSTPTPSSMPLIREALQDIASRPSPEIVIVGHTDRAGSDAINDPLSLKRAADFANWLQHIGHVPAAMITATGRGSRDAVDATGSGPYNADDRRVDIIVR